jgi:hypothetical protein
LSTFLCCLLSGTLGCGLLLSCTLGCGFLDSRQLAFS